MIRRLHDEYLKKKAEIRKRLDEFSRFYQEPLCWNLIGKDMVLIPSEKDHDSRLFEELCFCILTANTSAESGMKAIDNVRSFLEQGNAEEISSALKSSGYRFYNKRAEYIVKTRDNIGISGLRPLLESFDSASDAREYLVKNVKGFSYKEASHFLRNIGFRDLAILDKHILRSMKELGVIEEIPKSLNRHRYLEHELLLKEFSKDIGIDVDELDLLLWSIKNGKIMK